MADLRSLSSPDSSDDSAAVEDLISQAIDLSSLEQIAALNTSLVSDSVLPTDLETRFRKLKSFPGAGDPNPRKLKSPKQSEQTPGEETPFSDEHRKSSNGSRKHLGSSPDSGIENFLSEGLNAEKDRDPKSKSRHGSFSSPSISSSSSVEAAPHSPPQQTCCFWCSPKRVSRKKSEEKRDLGDLSPFPLKDHQRKMEKILKEQEKMISREAEKVLKWAKQASAK